MGRSKKSSLTSEQQEVLLEDTFAFVRKNHRKILEGLLARAEGCRAVRRNAAGLETVYTVLPSEAAAKILLESAQGRPGISKEKTSGRLLSIASLLSNADGNDHA